MQTSKQELEKFIIGKLEGSGYELITLEISPENEILVEVDSLKGTDVDFCAELNRKLVEYLEGKNEPDYSLEVGSVSIVAPFKTKMQYEKHLGHPVEVKSERREDAALQDASLQGLGRRKRLQDAALQGQGRKMKGQLVSVDEETFSVDVEEKAKVKNEKGKVKIERKIQTYTFRYDEVEYCRYDLKF